MSRVLPTTASGEITDSPLTLKRTAAIQQLKCSHLLIYVDASQKYVHLCHPLPCKSQPCVSRLSKLHAAKWHTTTDITSESHRTLYSTDKAHAIGSIPYARHVGLAEFQYNEEPLLHQDVRVVQERGHSNRHRVQKEKKNEVSFVSFPPLPEANRSAGDEPEKRHRE